MKALQQLEWKPSNASGHVVLFRPSSLGGTQALDDVIILEDAADADPRTTEVVPAAVRRCRCSACGLTHVPLFQQPHQRQQRSNSSPKSSPGRRAASASPVQELMSSSDEELIRSPKRPRQQPAIVSTSPKSRSSRVRGTEKDLHSDIVTMFDGTPAVAAAAAPSSTSTGGDSSRNPSAETALVSRSSSLTPREYFALLQRHYFQRSKRKNGSNESPSTAEQEGEATELSDVEVRKLSGSGKIALQLELPSSSQIRVDILPDEHPYADEAGLNSGYYKRFFVERGCLGRGGFAAVYHVSHVLHGVDLGDFAVKKVAIGELSGPWMAQTMREVTSMRKLRSHRNIVNYFHSWLECVQTADWGPAVPTLFILMEYANAGTLSNIVYGRMQDLSPKAKAKQARELKRRRSVASSVDVHARAQAQSRAEVLYRNAAAFTNTGGLDDDRPRLTCEEVLAFVADIVNALHFIHSSSIVHRDIKLQNILVVVDHSPSGAVNTERPDIARIRLLVSDLGTSITGQEIRQARSARSGASGTVGFMAPELIERDANGKLRSNYDASVDMWSLGVLIHTLVYRGLLPFAAANVEDSDPAAILSEVLHFDEPDFNSPPVEARSNPGHGRRNCARPDAHDPRFDSNCACDLRLLDMIRALLQRDPSKRPTSAALAKSSFLKPVINRRYEQYMASTRSTLDDERTQGAWGGDHDSGDEQLSDPSLSTLPRVTSVSEDMVGIHRHQNEQPVSRSRSSSLQGELLPVLMLDSPAPSGHAADHRAATSVDAGCPTRQSSSQRWILSDFSGLLSVFMIVWGASELLASSYVLRANNPFAETIPLISEKSLCRPVGALWGSLPLSVQITLTTITSVFTMVVALQRQKLHPFHIAAKSSCVAFALLELVSAACLLPLKDVALPSLVLALGLVMFVPLR